MQAKLLLIMLLLQPFFVLQAADFPPLSGQWRLEVKDSDDVRKHISKSLERIDITAVRIVNTSRGPIAMGNFRRKPTEEQVDIVFEFLNSITPLIPVISIKHEEPSITLTYADGQERTVFTDGRDSAVTVQTTALNQDQKLVFAAWEERMLMIETNTNSGTTMVEQLMFDEENNILKLIIAVDSTKLPKIQNFEYVYSSAK